MPTLIDGPEGKTHFWNDGCGIEDHNGCSTCGRNDKPFVACLCFPACDNKYCVDCSRHTKEVEAETPWWWKYLSVTGDDEFLNVEDVPKVIAEAEMQTVAKIRAEIDEVKISWEKSDEKFAVAACDVILSLPSLNPKK